MKKEPQVDGGATYVAAPVTGLIVRAEGDKAGLPARLFAFVKASGFHSLIPPSHGASPEGGTYFVGFYSATYAAKIVEWLKREGATTISLSSDLPDV